MGKPSKAGEVLQLFFEEPTRHWHFSEIKEKISLPENKISRWLKIFIQRKIIQKFTPKQKMPYYSGNYENPEYQYQKKIYALQHLHDSGFLNHLASLKSAKTIILFGSFSRWDWHKNSDIDLFIFGDDGDLEQAKYEKILNRQIQLFTCKDKKQFKKFNRELMVNIIKGDLIKGDLDFMEVCAHA